MTSKRLLIGHIGVDSGQVIIGDPVYLIQGRGERGVPAIGYLSRDEINLSNDEPYRAIPFQNKITGLAVITSTFLGDGLYPVYADVDEYGQVKRVTVEF